MVEHPSSDFLAGIGDQEMSGRKLFVILCIVAILSGLFLRTYHLRESGLFFYDEANYLHHALPALELIKANPPATGGEAWAAFQFYLKIVLASGEGDARKIGMAMANGANSLLRKPFGIESLLRHLQSN